jgi:hypothetical protein
MPSEPEHIRTSSSLARRIGHVPRAWDGHDGTRWKPALNVFADALAARGPVARALAQ